MLTQFPLPFFYLEENAADTAAALSEEEREVLHLVCCEDRRYQEAADLLGVPVEVVTARLLRARRALLGLPPRTAPGASAVTRKLFRAR